MNIIFYLFNLIYSNLLKIPRSESVLRVVYERAEPLLSFVQVSHTSIHVTQGILKSKYKSTELNIENKF